MGTKKRELMGSTSVPAPAAEQPSPLKVAANAAKVVTKVAATPPTAARPDLTVHTVHGRHSDRRDHGSDSAIAARTRYVKPRALLRCRSYDAKQLRRRWRQRRGFSEKRRGGIRKWTCPSTVAPRS
jgi:hypothetical protein